MPTETVTVATDVAEENILLITPAPEELEQGLSAEALEKEAAEATFSAEAVVTVGTAEAKPTPLDNALTLGIVGVLAVTLIIAVIRKAISNKKASNTSGITENSASDEVSDVPVAPGTAGEVKLHNVEPKTAAMLMAIVADKLQKPINELRFISIKEVE